MKKLLLLSLVLLTLGSASADTRSEEVTVDLESSEVEVDLQIGELSTSDFTYTTSYPVNNVRVEINGEEKNCEVERLPIGSEIVCENDKKENLSVNLEFTGSGLIEARNGINVFNYRKSFSSPTDSFKISAILPQGTGILDQGNVSTPVILPAEHQKGSTGRRIIVSWELEPELGETINFQLVYEELSDGSGNSLVTLIITFASIFLVLAGGYFVWRRLNLSDLESLYEDLSEDEIELLELLRDKDGEMLQKDVVDSSEYSKAKISEIVSSLEEMDVLVKEKEGRSNKLKISKNYRY